MKVVVAEFMDEAALEEFGAAYSVLYDPKLVDDRPRLQAEMADAAAIIVRNRTQVDATLLEAAPGLKVVGRLGVGLDNIDMGACAGRGVAVHPATGANTLSVAEYVVSTALSLARGAYASNAAMIAGDWPRNALMGGEVSGRVLGLYGFGAIAQAVADRAASLGMQIIAHDPYLPADAPAWRIAKSVTADALIAQADILSLHVPLTEETQNMFDGSRLQAMKAGSILINTARGGIVDEPALATALTSGHLGGAALDVFAKEPLTAEAAQVFANCPNLILTPHIAGVTQEGNVRVSHLTVQNVISELST